MLGSNWKSLIASNAIRVGVGQKRKAEEDQESHTLAAEGGTTNGKETSATPHIHIQMAEKDTNNVCDAFAPPLTGSRILSSSLFPV